MYRLISLLIGYIFGNILTAEIVSRRTSGESVFDRGTGNSGMANIVNLDGVKYGAIVLVGDLAKTFIPCLLCRFALFPEQGVLAATYAGLGVILGHNFPIWHKLKGGKGVSCTCAALVCISFGYGLLACIIGLIGVVMSSYLPIGAILIPIAFLLPAFLKYGVEVGVLAVGIALIMFQRHLQGLKGVFAGTEPESKFIRKIRREIRRRQKQKMRERQQSGEMGTEKTFRRYGWIGILAVVLVVAIVLVTVLPRGGEDEVVASETQDVEIEDQTEDASQEEQQEELLEDVWSYEANVTENTADFSESIVSEYGVLINVSTGEILAQRDAYEQMNPASMTKILTVLVAAENITEEQLDDTFTMTDEISSYCFANDCSVVGYEVGEVATVREMFYGTILSSGADAALGLATYVAGSHEAFVDLMNEKLEEMGLSETTHFTNCVGLYDDDHYSTAYDMAIILKAATDNEWCREVMSTHIYMTEATAQHPEGQVLSNWFLRRIEDRDTHGEVLCAKTGYVTQSGSCAASLANDSEGNEYICVTAGSTSSWRCIYDHVDLYTTYLPEIVETTETDTTEDTETAEETDTTE